MNQTWENRTLNNTDSESREDIDFHFRKAITELSRLDDRKFTRNVSRIIAACIFAAAILIVLLSF